MNKLFLMAFAATFALTSCGTREAAPVQPQADIQTLPAPSAESRIAYVNLDTLLARYELAIDLRASFEAKAKKVDGQLTSRGRKLENDFRDAQDKVQKGLVTRAQAAELEEKLGRQQQELMQHREKALSELAEEEQVMNNRIYYGVTDFLKEFNEGYKYAMIFSTSASGPILSADPSMDITAQVLRGLNSRYAEEKAKESK